MKTAKVFLFLLLIPFFTKAQTPETLINKFLTAINSSDSIDNVNTYKYNRSYVANANTDYDEEVVIVADKKQLSRKKTLMKRDFYYVLNGNQGWVKIPMGSLDKKPTYNVKDLGSKEIGELSTEATDGIFPFVNFEKKGYKLSSSISSANVDGKATTKLAIEKDGLEREYYFDNASGLLVREVWTENKITHTIDYTKYDTTSLGAKLPVSGTYINSKDKRKNNISTTWEFQKPADGVSFTK